MNISFENKIILITGAGAGIGKHLVKSFIQGNAAKVYGLVRTTESKNALLKEIPSVIPVIANLTDLAATKIVVEDIGPIDILINNAGICESKSLLECSLIDYDKIFDVNVKALWFVTQTVIAGMVERKQPGAVVNISSRCALVGIKNLSIYSATKGAIDSLTRSLAAEFGPKQIRVNAVNPALVQTNMASYITNDNSRYEQYISKVPLGRICVPEDVSNVVLFLASEKASMIQGTCISIDGGLTMAG